MFLSHISHAGVADTFTLTAGPAGLLNLGTDLLLSNGVLALDLDAEGFKNDLLW